MLPNAYLALEAIEDGFLTHVGRVFIQLNSRQISGICGVAEDDRASVKDARVNDHHAPSCDRIAGDVDIANSQGRVFASIAGTVARKHVRKSSMQGTSVKVLELLYLF